MKELRERYGLTCEDVDRILKVKRGTCSRWETTETTPTYVIYLLACILKEA